MMFSRTHLLLSITVFLGSCAYAMEEQNPMDAGWFYREDNPYASANTVLQQRNWPQAEREYSRLLGEHAGSAHDQDMAALNLASAQMAQRNASKYWQAFGKLCGIPADRLLTQERLASLTPEEEEEENSTVTVRSNMVGIGDIAHFLPVVSMLKKRGVDVRLAVRKFMHTPLQGPSKAYGVPLIDEREVGAEGYQTHLVALYGLLEVAPTALASERALYTTTESALGKIREALAPHKTISIVFLGENRPATLIGGKQLPRDAAPHGRELDARAFERLLAQEPNLVLLDCNPEKSRISFEQDDAGNRSMSKTYQDRVVPLPAENTPFDSVIALGLIWNKEEERFVGFAADNGPPNLFSRTLNGNAQRRFAYVIPNGSEYDMRMEGEGKKYTQMLSNCPVYRCDNPAEQAETIAKVYKDITRPAESSSSDSDSWCTVI